VKAGKSWQIFHKRRLIRRMPLKGLRPQATEKEAVVF
jgi:hypothetical protein